MTRSENVLFTQSLRLPDEIQGEVEQRLESAKQTSNWVIEQLLYRLGDFLETDGYAYRQVENYLQSPYKNSSRQLRYEAETAGVTFRAQATRKQVLDKIKPILSESYFMPITPPQASKRQNSG